DRTGRLAQHGQPVVPQLDVPAGPDMVGDVHRHRAHPGDLLTMAHRGADRVDVLVTHWQVDAYGLAGRQYLGRRLAYVGRYHARGCVITGLSAEHRDVRPVGVPEGKVRPLQEGDRGAVVSHCRDQVTSGRVGVDRLAGYSHASSRCANGTNPTG